ncbi:hypothetical protein D3C81_1278390 [compost metagenome]
MPEDKKGLSWFRLILVQVVIGCLLIGICSYIFRIPMNEVSVVAPSQDDPNRFTGIPMRVNLTYPGLGTITIDDPKELLKLKSSFSDLLAAGNERKQNKAPRLLLTGMMAYLYQEDIPFTVETNAFRFGDVSVNSLNVSANIRKLQSTLIDKVLTTSTIGNAIEKKDNEVFKLENGELSPLSPDERNALISEVRSAARVIDFSHFDNLEQQPNAHFVIQLTEYDQPRKHWIHLDRFGSIYFVVYDLLDETNQRAYFKLNDASY